MNTMASPYFPCVDSYSPDNGGRQLQHRGALVNPDLDLLPLDRLHLQRGRGGGLVHRRDLHARQSSRCEYHRPSGGTSGTGTTAQGGTFTGEGNVRGGRRGDIVFAAFVS